MRTLSPPTLEIVDSHWAQDLGCSREELRPPHPQVHEHGGGRLQGYSGVFILVLGGAPVVSAPPHLIAGLRARARSFTVEAVEDPSTLEGCLAPAVVARVIGPAQLCYADAGSFERRDVPDTRELSTVDQGQFDTLRSACTPTEWDSKKFDLAEKRTFGAFGEGEQLLAIADFEIWAGRIAHLSVVTHPAARGHGHGTRAVAAAAGGALDEGLVLQYRALRANGPSLSVCAKLGFEDYGWSIAARLAA